jgi:hypothetical protein
LGVRKRKSLVNGKHRDSILTDIVHWGLPTLSPEADDCFRRIVRLSESNQTEALEHQVRRWLAGVESTSVDTWLLDPTIYLADLEPDKVAELTETLKSQLATRVRDARDRGWEVD